AQQMLILRYPRRIRPDGYARLGQLLPGEQRPGIKLALRCYIAMANYPLRRQAVPLQNVLQQRNQPVDLRLIPGLPLTPFGGVMVAGVHDLDADGTGIEPGAALPATFTGVPGAAV